MKYTGLMWQPNWDERTKLVASLIPAGSKVIDFGCGTSVLKKELPKDCSYWGYNQDDFDLEHKKWPTLPKHDVAVFCGVLEYLKDPMKVIGRMTAKTLIVTYDCYLSGQDMGKRKQNGWRSHLTAMEMQDGLKLCGYTFEDHLAWCGQRIFRCMKL